MMQCLCQVSARLCFGLWDGRDCQVKSRSLLRIMIVVLHDPTFPNLDRTGLVLAPSLLLELRRHPHRVNASVSSYINQIPVIVENPHLIPILRPVSQAFPVLTTAPILRRPKNTFLTPRPHTLSAMAMTLWVKLPKPTKPLRQRFIHQLLTVNLDETEQPPIRVRIQFKR